MRSSEGRLTRDRYGRAEPAGRPVMVYGRTPLSYRQVTLLWGTKTVASYASTSARPTPRGGPSRRTKQSHDEHRGPDQTGPRHVVGAQAHRRRLHAGP